MVAVIYYAWILWFACCVSLGLGCGLRSCSGALDICLVCVVEFVFLLLVWLFVLLEWWVVCCYLLRLVGCFVYEFAFGVTGLGAAVGLFRLVSADVLVNSVDYVDWCFRWFAAWLWLFCFSRSVGLRCVVGGVLDCGCVTVLCVGLLFAGLFAWL